MRGMAIAMIVLFHLLPESFSQGYFGVEIFLVISGYLLFRSWKEGVAFPLKNFVLKKIVRIVPLLCVLSLITVIVFWQISLSESAVSLLGKSAMMSIIGASNEYYAKTYADYFAPGSNLNPLLHSWYLSVTLQVFAIWAIGGMLLSRVKRGWRIGIVVFVGVLSLVYDYLPQVQEALLSCGMSVQISKDASYYGMLNRLWMVLAGGMVFVMPTQWNKTVANIVSLIALIVMLWLAFCNKNHGELVSLLVVAATVVTLAALPHSHVKRMIELPIFVWPGIISFSLYIVHFPIIVFYKQWERSAPVGWDALLLLVIMVVMAYIVWFCVEKRKINIGITIIMFVVALGVASTAKYHKTLNIGFPCSDICYPVYKEEIQPLHPEIHEGLDLNVIKSNEGTSSLLYNDPEVLKDATLLTLGKQSSYPEYILIGDSNAQHHFAGFNKLSHQLSVSGVHVTSIVIPQWDRYTYIHRSYYWNEAKYHAIMNWLKAQPKVHTVVIAQLWTRLLNPKVENWSRQKINSTFDKNVDCVRKFCEDVRATGKQVVLVTPSPRLWKFSRDVHGTGIEYMRWLYLRDKLDKKHLPPPFVLTLAEHKARYARVMAFLNKWEEEGLCKLLRIEKGSFRYGASFLGVSDGVLRARDATHVTPLESEVILQSVADDFMKIIEMGRRR